MQAEPASLPESRSLRKGRNLLPGMLDAFFVDFNTLGDPELVKALEQAKLFCEDMASADKPGRWLTLLGPSGTGKTMLTRCINRFYQKLLDGMPDERETPNFKPIRRGGFKSWLGIVNDLLAGDFSGLRDLKEDWFICLDDIGVEYSSNRDLATTKLFDIMNSRIGKFTVFTANITLEDIGAKLDVRISSRLLRDKSSVVNVDCEDFNLRG